MIPFSAYEIFCVLEPVLIAATLFAFVKGRDKKEFPTFAAYLVWRISSILALNVLLYEHNIFHIDRHHAYAAYYYAYIVSYLAGAGMIFFVIRQMFGIIMAPLPGLKRLGLIAFKWVAISSVVLALASVVFPMGSGKSLFVSIPIDLMRCVSLLQLSLLAFLAVSVQTLGLSYRSRAFGISMGFGLLACMDFLATALAFQHPNLSSTINLVAQAGTDIALLLWTIYFALPEPARQPITLPVSSPLLKWNEIAMALGHPPPQVALSQSSEFFLDDVEKVVDRILARNSMDVAS